MADFRNRILTDAESIDWKDYARSGRKVEAIKDFRGRYGAGLKEAKDVVEEYCDRLNRGERFTGTDNGVTTTSVQLPNGVMNIVNNGLWAAITFTKTVAVNVRQENLAQAIADAALRCATYE